MARQRGLLDDVQPAPEGKGGYCSDYYDCGVPEKGNKCHYRERRPKFEVFDHCFPRKIKAGMGGHFVEVNCNVLFMFWKHDPSDPQFGQLEAWRNLTRLSESIIVYVIVGCARTMSCAQYLTIQRGVVEKWLPVSLSQIQQEFSDWSKWASHNRGATKF